VFWIIAHPQVNRRKAKEGGHSARDGRKGGIKTAKKGKKKKKKREFSEGQNCFAPAEASKGKKREGDQPRVSSSEGPRKGKKRGEKREKKTWKLPVLVLG